MVTAADPAAGSRSRDTRPADAQWRLATRVLLGLVLVVILATFRHYGMTWDEEHSTTNGQFFLRWYSSGFTDRSIIDTDNQRLYGSFFNGVSRLLSERSPAGLYETGHLVTALFGWLALWAVARMGRMLMDERAGFFAALALVLTPVWYGHSFNNPKDVPFAVMYVVALTSMVAVYRHLPRPRVADTMIVGAAIGLALGIRVGAVVLLGCFWLLFACWAYAQARSTGARASFLWRSQLAFIPSLALAILVAWLVMLPWWPYAQLSPIAHPIEAVRESSRFQWTAVVLYHGSFVPAQELPRDYLPRWLSKTLPDYYGVLALGVIAAILIERRRGTRPAANLNLRAQLFFVAVSAAGLPIVAVLTKAVMYDAYRHFLFAIPPVAVLVGCGVSWLFRRPSVALKAAVLSPVALSAVLTLVDMVQLHPYQSVYFNRLNYGLPGAFGRYETDYWGASHREGVEWLAARYRPDAPPRSIRVKNSAVELFTGYYIDNGGPRMERFVSVAPDAEADVVLSVRRWNLHERYQGNVIHTVSRMGVPLLHIIEPTPPLAADATPDPDASNP